MITTFFWTWRSPPTHTPTRVKTHEKTTLKHTLAPMLANELTVTNSDSIADIFCPRGYLRGRTFCLHSPEPHQFEPLGQPIRQQSLSSVAQTGASFTGSAKSSSLWSRGSPKSSTPHQKNICFHYKKDFGGAAHVHRNTLLLALNRHFILYPQ